MRLIFSGIEQCNNKEIFSWDYIQHAYLKCIKLKNKGFICFASDEEEPNVYIVCDEVKYEEIAEQT